jgi:hypothetical protein
LWADPSTDSRQEVVSLDDVSGFLEFLLGDEPDELTDVDTNGAAIDARRMVAQDAALGLGDSLLR